jgi:transposase
MELRQRIATLEALVEAQRQEITELKARLSQDSSNSSKPPSSDLPKSKPQPALGVEPTGRKRGGQPGHDKHERQLVPPEKVTQTEAVKPELCLGCGQPLSGEDPEPHRHQVIEIPRITPTVHEYQLHSLQCGVCRHWTRALLPDGVPSGQFGPRLQAMVAVATGAYRMSKRTVQEMLSDWFAVEISLGSISNLEQATSDVLQAPVEQVGQAIQKERVGHADETGWYQRAQRAWLWVFASAQMAFFLIDKNRSAQVAKALLGTFCGVLVSDRWSAYNWVPVERRQLCWAHLIRQFVGFQDYGGKAKEYGCALETLAKEMFGLWYRVRDGTLSRPEFQLQMKPMERAVVDLLHACTRLSHKKVAGRAREILLLEPALWTFVRQAGVEPTNNHAERLVRHGVLWRKSSHGTDSDAGSRFVERILTTVATLRLQRRNVLDYLTVACEGALLRRPPPSLLPQPAAIPVRALAA